MENSPNSGKGIHSAFDLCCATATQHCVAAKNKSRCGFWERHATQVEAIFSALSQELPERHHLRNARELVRHKVVFIKNPDGLTILHYRRNVRVEMDDQTALQILGAYFRRTRRGRLRDQIEMVAQSLRV